MRMIFGAIGGMKIGRGNRSTQRKPTPAPLCPPQNPTWQTPSRTPDRSGGKPATNRLNYGVAFLAPFRRLLRLAGSRWRYSTPPPHGFSLVVTKISSYTLKITVTIAHVTSHTKPSNSSSGHTAVPLEFRNSSEVNSHSHILWYPLGTDHGQKTQSLYCRMAQTTLKTSHVIASSPPHWRADCCLAMSYKHSSYCCVTLSEVFIASLSSYTRYNIYIGYSAVSHTGLGVIWTWDEQLFLPRV
jgi:hypothetical protein